MHSPEVQDVIATKVTDAIEKQVDIEAILNNVFAGVITDRPRLEQLVGPLAAAINGLIDREVRAFIASDAVRRPLDQRRTPGRSRPFIGC